MTKTRALLIAAATGLTASASQAALIAQYGMNSPTQLVNSAGATTIEPDLFDPGSTASPTYLPSGGVNGSGAFQFDGVNDNFRFGPSGTGSMYAGLNGVTQAFVSGWTVSFWIKTSDSAVFTGGFQGNSTPEIPVLGQDSNNIAFGLGIDGGKATYRRYNGTAAFVNAQGLLNVADGVAHYITFVANGTNASNLSIYVDGQLDVGNLSVVPNTTNGQYAENIGSSYTGHYGAFNLDDLRVYDTALDSSTIASLFSVPEPASLILLAAGGLTFLGRRRKTMAG